MAAKAFREIGNDESAANAYLESAKCHEHEGNHQMAADSYANCATCMTDDRWQKSMQYLEQADILYKIAGHDDRGFTLMKRLALQLCDSIENRPVFNSGLEVYRRIFPKLFEGQNMVMNYDLLETYVKALA